MSHPPAVVILLPAVPLERRGERDWREQRAREERARRHDKREEPPRTRPILVDLGKYRG